MSPDLGTRRDARERALELLYEADAKAVTPDEVIAELPVQPDSYALDVVHGVGANQPEIDDLIRRFAKGWTLERMPVIDRALLRMAIYELGHRDDVSTGTIINEAVELAKRFSTDDSGRFVNGMLGRIAEELRPQPES